ncbi:MAG: T9SS type A sorting domain-containing protein [Bacteroidetes bacterium]|nr:T9SS type A sorting domain-containing protein [Bacteroidota bacterium]
MRSPYLSFIVLLLCSSSFLSFGQGPKIQWTKCYGGSMHESIYDVQQTADGGYIMVGYSYSNDGVVTGHFGSGSFTDVLAIKTDALGNIIWIHSFGGSDNDGAYSVQQTRDGGYIIAGYTYSSDGDVTGHYSGLFQDVWILKLDVGGHVIWQKCLGGSDDDFAKSIHQTADGGYIFAGATTSNDGNVTNLHKDAMGYYTEDMWVVKLDDTGAIQWQKTLGGGANEEANSVKQTKDGGYIVAGFTFSTNGDVAKHYGGKDDWDAWAVKLGSSGTIQWSNTFGGTQGDEFSSVIQDLDNSYVFTGYTTSNDYDVTDNHLNAGSSTQDLWVVKLGLSGSLTWQKCFGGSMLETGNEIRQDSDSGYVIAGYTDSDDGDVSGFHTSSSYLYDGWVLRLDTKRNMTWQRCIGGSLGDLTYAMKLTNDGGCILGGVSASSDGDITCTTYGDGDFWLTKLAGPLTGIDAITTEIKSISIYPNPLSNWTTIHYDMNAAQSTGLKVTDVCGTTLLDMTLPPNKNEFTINAATWQPGIYFYKVLQNGNTLQTGKLLKQ